MSESAPRNPSTALQAAEQIQRKGRPRLGAALGLVLAFGVQAGLVEAFFFAVAGAVAGSQWKKPQ